MNSSGSNRSVFAGTTGPTSLVSEVDENYKPPQPKATYKQHIRYLPTNTTYGKTGESVSSGPNLGNRTALSDVTSKISNTRHSHGQYVKSSAPLKVKKNYISSRHNNVGPLDQPKNWVEEIRSDPEDSTHDKDVSIMEIDETAHNEKHRTQQHDMQKQDSGNNDVNEETENNISDSSVVIVSEPYQKLQKNIDNVSEEENKSHQLDIKKIRKKDLVGLEEKQKERIEEPYTNRIMSLQGPEPSNPVQNVRFGPVDHLHRASYLKTAFEKYHRLTPDPDDEDTYDPTMVVEYCNEIFEHTSRLEKKLCADPNYIDYQPDLTWKHRHTLLNWLVQVHEKFNLLQETLYLAVNIMDRFLSHTEIALDKFHLVGSTCLFIASKYEEINCIVLKDLLKILDDEYTESQVIRAERYILCALEFELGWPGPMSYLRRISKADEYDFDIRTLAKYLLETTIMEPSFVASPPSWIAAGAYYLSLVIFRDSYCITHDGLVYDDIWTSKHTYYAGYTEQQITPAAAVIAQNCRYAETKHEAIFKKYSQKRHRKCSQMVAKWIEYLEAQERELKD